MGTLWDWSHTVVISEVGGGESFVTPPTGKSCFVFVFALRACVRARDATRDQMWYLGMSLFLLCCCSYCSCSGRCVVVL